MGRAGLGEGEDECVKGAFPAIDELLEEDRLFTAQVSVCAHKHSPACDGARLSLRTVAHHVSK
jgi:hypothetical protein